MKEITTIQMVPMVKLSVYQPVSNACTGSNPTRGQFFSIFLTASDARKAVYIHQQHSMGDTPYIGTGLEDDYIHKPQVIVRYTLHINTMTLLVINVSNLRFSGLPHT